MLQCIHVLLSCRHSTNNTVDNPRLLDYLSIAFVTLIQWGRTGEGRGKGKFCNFGVPKKPRAQWEKKTYKYVFFPLAYSPVRNNVNFENLQNSNALSNLGLLLVMVHLTDGYMFFLTKPIYNLPILTLFHTWTPSLALPFTDILNSVRAALTATSNAPAPGTTLPTLYNKKRH